MRRFTIAFALFAIGLAAGGALYSRGPIGSLSVSPRKVDEMVGRAAQAAHARVTSAAAVGPSSIPLSGTRRAKWALKTALSKIGVTLPEAEAAVAYSIVRPGSGLSLRFFVRVRGDDVIAVAIERGIIDDEFLARFVDAVHAWFPGYKIGDRTRAA
jgi:hypothetical protein